MPSIFLHFTNFPVCVWVCRGDALSHDLILWLHKGSWHSPVTSLGPSFLSSLPNQCLFNQLAAPSHRNLSIAWFLLCVGSHSRFWDPINIQPKICFIRFHFIILWETVVIASAYSVLMQQLLLIICIQYWRIFCSRIQTRFTKETWKLPSSKAYYLASADNPSILYICPCCCHMSQ